MDPNISRRNIFMYHDNPYEAPLVSETIRYIEKFCGIHMNLVLAKDLQYAKPLMVLLCPIQTKTDQDVNALLDSSKDGEEVLLVIIKRAWERARNKDSLAHLSDPLSTTTRNRIGAACTLFFAGKEKFKGYKNENAMAIREICRCVNLAIEHKQWSITFPAVQKQDQVDSWTPQGQQPRPIQFVNSNQTQQPSIYNIQQFPQPGNPFQSQSFQSPVMPQVQQATAAPTNNTVQRNQPVQIHQPPVPEIKIIPPQPQDAGSPFAAQVSDPTPQSKFDDDDFFNPRGDSSKPSSNPFGDSFAEFPEPQKTVDNPFADDPFVPKQTVSAASKPAPAPALPRDVKSPVYFFFDDTSPLGPDTKAFVEEHGKFELKRCRKQTAAVVSPLLIFSPCYTLPDADAKSILGQCRDGDDVFLVVIQPVHSHTNKEATLSQLVYNRIGAYGVLAYSMDTKSYKKSDKNLGTIKKVREFIIDKQPIAEPEDEEEEEEVTQEETGSKNVLVLEDFHGLGFDESEA